MVNRSSCTFSKEYVISMAVVKFGLVAFFTGSVRPNCVSENRHRTHAHYIKLDMSMCTNCTPQTALARTTQSLSRWSNYSIYRTILNEAQLQWKVPMWPLCIVMQNKIVSQLSLMFSVVGADKLFLLLSPGLPGLERPKKPNLGS